MSRKLFEKITIIGVGLLGASLAKACRKYNLVEEISGFGRNRENLEKAKSLGIIDRYAAELAESEKDAELIVLRTPVSLIVPAIESL